MMTLYSRVGWVASEAYGQCKTRLCGNRRRSGRARGRDEQRAIAHGQPSSISICVCGPLTEGEQEQKV